MLPIFAMPYSVLQIKASAHLRKSLISLLFLDCPGSERSPLGCRLCPSLDAQQHLPIHHQTDRFHENAVDQRISQTRVVVAPPPADQPRSPFIEFVQKEHPAYVKVLFRYRVCEIEGIPGCVSALTWRTSARHGSMAAIGMETLGWSRMPSPTSRC